MRCLAASKRWHAFAPGISPRMVSARKRRMSSPLSVRAAIFFCRAVLVRMGVFRFAGVSVLQLVRVVTQKAQESHK